MVLFHCSPAQWYNIWGKHWAFAQQYQDIYGNSLYLFYFTKHYQLYTLMHIYYLILGTSINFKVNTKLPDQENSLQFKRFLLSSGRCPVHPNARQFYSFKKQTDFDHKWGQKEMIEFLSAQIFEITEWRLTGWLKYWHTADYLLMIASVQQYQSASRHQPPATARASTASSLFD